MKKSLQIPVLFTVAFSTKNLQAQDTTQAFTPKILEADD